MKKQSLLITAFQTLILVLMGSGLYAQANFFKPIRGNGLPKAVETVKSVKKYDIVKLDEAALRSYLLGAPMEFQNNGLTLPLQVPLPNGRTETFGIVESPVLSPEVAAQHPEIRTYTGNGLGHKEAVIRFALTSAGFSAILLDVGGETVYFEHYSKQEKDVYFNYFVSDAKVPEGFSTPTCGVEADVLKAFNKPSGEKVASTGENLRTYKLAMAGNVEFTTNNGGTPGSGLAKIVSYVNTLNAIYRRELSVAFTLVSGTNLVFAAEPDGYTNSNQTAMLEENQLKCDAVIGNPNYDIGHVMGFEGGSGGGIAAGGSVCNAPTKGQGVSGEGAPPYAQVFSDQLVLHEVGHQFGMNHSYNSSLPVCTTRNQPTSVEPGAGATIMSYGFTCGTDDYFTSTTTGPILQFHTTNYSEAVAYIATTSCAVSTPTGNAPPTVTMPAAVTIPKSTPFALTGSAGNSGSGDSFTYCWEGMNVGSVEPPDATTLADPAKPPFFRSYEATTSATRTYPTLDSILNKANVAKGDKLPSVSIPTLHRLTVRDNNAAGGGVAFGEVTVTVDGNIGPFLETTNLAASYPGNSMQTITWSVNGTNVATPNVKISISTDGGLTFPTVLAASTANDGSEAVTLPNVATTTARIKVEAVGNIFFDISNFNFTITGVACTPPTVTAPTVTQPTCALPSGTIVVNASGSGTLEYSVDNGTTWAATATFSALNPGSYNIKVRIQSDPACMAAYAQNPVVLNAPTGCCTPPTVTAPTVTQPTCALPSGTIVVNASGSGALEYSVDNGPAWQVSNSFASLNAGSYNIKVRLQSSPTCMATYAQNPVVLNAPTGCGGTPNCNDITITGAGNSITVSGLTAPITMVQIFNSSWATVFNCSGNCATPTQVVNSLAAGTYYVKVKYFTAAWSQICEKNEYVTLPGGPMATTLSINDVTVNENAGTATLQVCLSALSASQVTVNYATSDGTATAGSDYTTKTGTLTFAAGSLCQNISIPILDNTTREPTETFTVNLSNAVGATIADGLGVFTILDDDSTPAGCNSIAVTTVANSITVSGLSAPIVMVQVFNDPSWQTVYSCAGNCSTPTQSVTNLSPGLYHVRATLLTASWQQICVKNQDITVTGGGGGNTPIMSINNITVNENVGNATVQVCLSAATNVAVSVSYSTSNGTATAGSDYTAVSGTANIPAGTLCANIIVPILDNTLSEPTETFNVNLSNISAGAILGNNLGVVTIIDNDGTVTPDCSNVTVTGGVGKITVTGLNGAPTTSIQVFTSSWQPVYSCFANCQSPVAIIPLGVGTYIVYVKYFDANYALICQKTALNVSVAQSLTAPDDLFSFDIYQSEDFVRLNWATNYSHQVDHFEVERSVDGVAFEPLLQKISELTNDSELYQDYDTAPKTGDNFYRVKIVNLDGTIEFSNLKKAYFEDRDNYQLFPNPANQYVNINLESIVSEAVDIHFTNNLGVQVKTIHIDEVIEGTFTVNLNELKEGFYHVWIVSPGKRAVFKKLMVGKL
jgi:hypothetical protein